MSKNKFQLHLKGYVGGYDFDASYVDYVLGKNKDQEVNVLIDSLGGSVATALSISSAFAIHGNVTVHYVGMNASAATIASLGAKHVSIDASAMYLVHKCSNTFFQYGNLNADNLADLIDELSAAKDDLDKIDANIASMYARKCKKEASELLDLMKVGGWLTAQEALEWGFVNEITEYDNDKAPKLTDAVASAMASVGMPIPNLPIAEKESAISRFINSISNLFANKSDNNVVTNQVSTSMHKFSSLCALLNIEEFSATDGMVSLSVDQLTAIENRLADDDSEKSQLKQQIEALNKQPADTGKQVVETKADGNFSDAEKYVKSFNNARELFNMLP